MSPGLAPAELLREMISGLYLVLTSVGGFYLIKSIWVCARAHRF